MKHLINNQLNLMKIFCCFLVVYQHIVERFLNSSLTEKSTHLLFGIIHNFSKFAVPIFLFITGFLLIKSYETISLKDFYKNKFTRILYIYILSNLLFLIPVALVSNYSIKEFLTSFIWSNAVPHLWYLNILIKLYLIFPIFRYTTVKLNKSLGLKSVFLITFIQYIISENAYAILSKSTSTIGVTIFTYLDRSLITWMYYFILGGLVYKNFSTIYDFIYKYIKLFIVAFIAQIIYVNLYTFQSFKTDTVNYYRSSPSSFKVLILSLLSLIVLYYIADLIVKRDNFKIFALIKVFSKYTLAIYITHPIIIGISNLIMGIQNFLPYNIVAFIVISLVMIFSIMPFYMYDKLKKQKSIA
ncbi:acyltransferase [uncultured Clostridium sp.]|uniref:acyltransferase n=1 Tax=uncultured Clostridium sp. TaxID=59620 RepID=UPI002629B5AD|nr:acyltransferase [uncultured Clostridium sp.]